MIFREFAVEDFEKFVKKAPGANFMQSREMYERLVKNGREVYLVGVETVVTKKTISDVKRKGAGKKQKKVLAAGILMNMGKKMGKKIFGIGMGPLLDFQGKEWREVLACFTEGISKFSREHGGMAVEISPHVVVSTRDYTNKTIREDNPEVRGVLHELGYKDLGEVGQIKWEYVLNYRGKSEDEVLASFRKDVRTRIRQAEERYGVRIRDLKYDELSVMEEMTNEAASAHKFNDKDLKYYQEMYKAFGPKVRFVVAELPKEVAEGKVKRIDTYEGELSGEYVAISAVMYMLYGPEVVSLFSGVTRKYRNIGGCSHMIRWELIKYAMRHKYKRYDFYGVRPEEGNSVYEFKAGFRGEIEELAGTWILPTSIFGKAYVKRAKYRKYGRF